MNDYLKSIEQTYEPIHENNGYQNEPENKSRFLGAIFGYFFKDVLIAVLVTIITALFITNSFFFKEASPGEAALNGALYDVNSFLVITEDDFNSFGKKYEEFFIKVYTLDNDYLVITHSYGSFYNNDDVFDVDDVSKVITLNNDGLNSILNGDKTKWNDKALINFYIPNDISSNQIINSELYNEVSLIKERTLYTDNFIQIISLITYIILTVSLFFILKPSIKNDFNLLMENKDKQYFGKIITGILIIMAFNIAAGVISIAFNNIFGVPDDISANQLSINITLKSPYFITMIFTAVIMAPIVEELVFRKSIFSLIKNKNIALAVSAIVFGFIHVTSEFLGGDFLLGISNFITYLAGGLALGYLYLKNDKNIITVMLIHAGYNLFGIVIQFLPGFLNFF
ncbi:MAG: type II CAAX endopeptidase family protein [Acholeplasmataceae bacterium]